MQLEAHLISDGVLLRLEAGSYEHADAIRREVPNSRFVSKHSDRAKGIFAFKYPLSVDKCREMRSAWGDALKVHRDLSAWYREADALRAQQVALTTQADAELPVLAERYPAFNAWLKGDQRVTAKWMTNLYRNAGLVADEVGTGKTAGVIAGIIERGTTGSILVVCPKISVKAVWGKEFAQHVPDVPVFVCRGNRKAREKVLASFDACEQPTAVLVIVAEMLRLKLDRERGRVTKVHGAQYPMLFEYEWSGIVLDESHKLFGSADAVRGTDATEGLRKLGYTADAWRLAMSATPFGKGGKVERLFGSLNWLWPDEYSSRWAWLGKYFDVQDDRVYIKGGAGATKNVKRVGPVSEAQEKALWGSLHPRVLRRTMEEVSPEHKGLKGFTEVLCEMTVAQRQQYEAFAQDAELAVDGGIITTVGVLDFMTRCRQFSNGVLRKEGGRVTYTGDSGKLDRMMALLEQAEGRKVVIASQYNEFLDSVEERLLKEGYYNEWVGNPTTHKLGHYVRIDGKTSDAKREAYMAAFQGSATYPGPQPACPDCMSGKGREHGLRCRRRTGPNVFLLNGQAGGVSITLDAAEAMICLDEMDADSMTQLMGRIFRRGRVHQVMYYMLRSLGTIDERIGYQVGQRHLEQLRLLDGRRGLEYARTLAKYNEEG